MRTQGLLALVGVVALAGCVSVPTPTSTPSVTPTLAVTPAPSPTAGPLAVLALGADDLVARDADGVELARVGWDDPDGVTAELTGAFGVPVVREPSAEALEEGCLSTVTQWGDGGAVMLMVWPDGDLLLSFDDAELAGVGLESSTGLRVGDDASPIIAALPAGWGDADGVAFLYEAAADSTASDPRGGVAYHDGTGIVGSLVSPFVPVATDLC